MHTVAYWYLHNNILTLCLEMCVCDWFVCVGIWMYDKFHRFMSFKDTVMFSLEVHVNQNMYVYWKCVAFINEKWIAP